MTKAKQTHNILKALTSTIQGKQKELIVFTFKAITCGISEYAKPLAKLPTCSKPRNLHSTTPTMLVTHT